jgi:hypothetical protein
MRYRMRSVRAGTPPDDGHETETPDKRDGAHPHDDPVVRCEGAHDYDCEPDRDLTSKRP